MRARPEQTQFGDLSDASFLGKLLVLPANVKLDWKVIARYKHSSLFGLVINNEKKSFITLAPDVFLNNDTKKNEIIQNVPKQFYIIHIETEHNDIMQNDT